MTAVRTLAPPATTTGHPDFDLAHRYAPVLLLDSLEPYRPITIGFTVFNAAAQSPSSKFKIDPVADTVIEYAIYWDYDIKHIYDLEHVWVHIDKAGRVAAVEASQHGQRVPMTGGFTDNRVSLFVEPGEHALFATRPALHARADLARSACGQRAGGGGVHTKNLFGPAAFGDPSRHIHRLARLWLRRHAFAPAFDGAVALHTRDCPLVPWPDLAAWIPPRIRAICTALPEQVPHLAAVFLDCGDTLVDESTELKDAGEVVLSAELVAGATEAMAALSARGFRLALVADGPRQTFENVLGHHDLWHHFDAHITSGDIGHLKPAPQMFQAAFTALDLAPAAAAKVVMVGNNLARDIKGANDFGLISVFFDWSPRRPRHPATPDQVPRHTIKHLDQLVPLLDTIERDLL